MSATVFREQNKQDSFPEVDDDKLRLSLFALSDKINEDARNEILSYYNDPFLLREYQAIRDSGVFDSGDASKSMRQTVMYPSITVRDFIHTVMKELYGDDWLKNMTKYHKALRHELLRPWVTVGKI